LIALILVRLEVNPAVRGEPAPAIAVDALSCGFLGSGHLHCGMPELHEKIHRAIASLTKPDGQEIS